MIYEVFLHLLQCSWTLVFRNDLPSFLEIFIFELLLELINHRSPIQFFDGITPDTTLAAQPVTTVEEHIPVVHSFVIWKMCEALELKAKFVPLPGATALPRTSHKGVNQTTIVPVIGLFSVWKICQAIDLSATYDLQIIRTVVFRRSNNPVPVVHSTIIFELCKALDLKAKLAPQ
ncbi:hypothetical protein TNIN_380691 [Trichonephila inaurata madagascariensis]|uniref:Uncharacterized protein n=1 Tax=Trichonephila inaurata madagascariensis TaxID=2747483 RepID=A0A8X6XS53_9ARAC|nr:hypothetical protein TNIN_380691 [Trichonephila inaurata madagascariensis]